MRWIDRFSIIGLLAFPAEANAEETVVRTISLPGATIEREITFHPTEAAYLQALDARLRDLRAGKPGAYLNPADGPWMILQTTAKIGIEWHGFGYSEGQKDVRRVTAAEEALYRFEHE